MPGLMLRWRTESKQWPEEVLEVSELGRLVKSPDFGRRWKDDDDWGQGRLKNPNFPNFVHNNYRSYSVVLHLTSEVVQEVEKEGKLIVKIETDTQEGEVYVEEGIKRWQIFESQKSWKDAEKKCVEYGGHLSSVTTSEEILSAKDCWIGLNGTESEKVWRWSDGSTWNNFTNWENMGRQNIKKDTCVLARKDGWWSKRACKQENCFVCSFKGSHRIVQGEQNLNLEYLPGDLPLPLINITFVYNDTQSTKSKVENKTKIPGFSVAWSSSVRSNLTKVKQKEWKKQLFHPNPKEVHFLLTASIVTDLLKAGGEGEGEDYHI